MYINTYQRDKKTSHRIVKTQKQVYDEAMSKEDYGRNRTTEYVKPVKNFDEEFKEFTKRYSKR